MWREPLEAHFGHGFSAVRVHDGALAAEATRSVDAVAYTLGRDIAFAPGAFQPETPAGLHLLAHELAHVVQQDGAPATLSPSLVIGPVGDPLEREADRSADAFLRGERVSPPRSGPGHVQRLQRAVSKVCNPPSMWFALGGPANLVAAQAFGPIAELFISGSVVSTNGVAPGNFYLDNPLAGPIDPLLVAFIIGKNPGMSLTQQFLLATTTVVRPDVLMHQGALTEFEEVKPNSLPGRTAGRAKVRTLQAFYPGFSLPYRAGTTYTPPPPFVIVSGTINGVPLTITFEITRDRAGLLVYDICVETDWLKVAELAILIVIAIILAILSRGAIRRLPMPNPAPVPAFAGAGPSSQGARGGIPETPEAGAGAARAEGPSVGARDERLT